MNKRTVIKKLTEKTQAAKWHRKKISEDTVSYNYNKMPSQGICQSLCLWGIGGKTLLLSNFQDLGDLLNKNESFITNPFGFGKDILSFGLIWWKKQTIYPWIAKSFICQNVCERPNDS